MTDPDTALHSGWRHGKVVGVVARNEVRGAGGKPGVERVHDPAVRLVNQHDPAISRRHALHDSLRAVG